MRRIIFAFLLVILAIINCIEIPYRGVRISKSAKSLFKDNMALLNSLTTIVPPIIPDIKQEIGDYWNKRELILSKFSFTTFSSNFPNFAPYYYNFTETGILDVKGNGNIFNVQLKFNYEYEFFQGTIPISGSVEATFSNDMVEFTQNYAASKPKSNLYCKWNLANIHFSSTLFESYIKGWVINILRELIEPQFTYSINLQLDPKTNSIIDNYYSINQKYGALSIDILNTLSGEKAYWENALPYASFQFDTNLSVTNRPFSYNLYNTIYSQINPNSGINYDLSTCFNLDIFVHHVDIMGKSRYFFTMPTQDNISSPLTIDFAQTFRPDIASYFNDFENINIGCGPIRAESFFYINRTSTNDKLQIQSPWGCDIDSDRTGEKILKFNFIFKTYFKVQINNANNGIYFNAMPGTEITKLSISPESTQIGMAEASQKLIPFKYLIENFVQNLTYPGLFYSEIRKSDFTFKDYAMQNGEICIRFNDKP